jgi:hypothetical protein
MLDESRTTHVVPIPPIHRLPTELLSEIFILSPAPTYWPLPVWNTAFSIAAVCSHWRRVAFSTPRLWCTIYAILDQQDLYYAADMVRTMIERSGHCLLSVTLDSDDRYFVTHPVVDIVIHHSHRLQCFDIFVWPSFLRSLLPLKGHLPMLQTLTLFCRGIIEDALWDVIADAPQLSVLDSNCPPNMIELPFTQITRYSASNLNTSHCLEFLRKASNLIDCTIDGMAPFSNALHPLPVVSRLQTLSITSIRYIWHDPAKFFRLVTLPALREISVVFAQGIHWPHTDFMSLVTRSSCRLEMLKLWQVSMSSEDLIDCLEAIPSLRELDIGCAGDKSAMVNDAVLHKLTHYPTSAKRFPLVPSLHSVRFQGDYPFENDVLFDMVESRWCGELPKGLERLRSVRANLSQNFSPQAIACIEAWEEQGLDIVLTTSVSHRRACRQ